MRSLALWIRTVGTRAPWLVGAFTLIVGAVAHLGWLQGLALYVAGGAVVALVMTIPLAGVLALVPGETIVERRAREARQARERTELAKVGLTPEQYMATIPAADLIGRAEAAERFGIELASGRENAHSQIRIAKS
jgi:predicted lipid-binding transport protein (Tim44 family)